MTSTSNTTDQTASWKGVHVVLEGIAVKKKTEYINQLRKLGANVHYSLNKKVSHVVFGNGGSNKSKYQCASARLVSENWLAESIAQKTILEADNYVLPEQPNASLLGDKSYFALDSDWLRLENDATESSSATENIVEAAPVQVEEVKKPHIKRLVVTRDGKIHAMFADQTTRAVQPSKDDKTVASIKKRAEAEAEIDFVAPRLEAAKNLHVETVPLPNPTELTKALSVAVTVGTKAHFVGHSQRDRLTVPTILDSEGGQELFIKAIAVGGGHCVIVTYDGRCWSWGRAKSGQLGGGSISTAFVGAPREIQLKDVAVVACGENFSALLTSSGQLFLSGTIGDKNLFYSDKPTLVDVPRSIRPAKLFAASNSVAVVSENGQLFTLGLNSHGQLGVATESKFQRALQRVPLKDSVKSVAIGKDHMLGLSSGVVYAWGNTASGALGSPSSNGGIVKLQPDLFGGASVTTIAAGDRRSACITSTGAFYIWGRGAPGSSDISIPQRLLPEVLSKAGKSGGFVNIAIVDDSVLIQSSGGRLAKFEWSALQTEATDCSPVVLATGINSFVANSQVAIVSVTGIDNLILRHAADGNLEAIKHAIASFGADLATLDGEKNSILHFSASTKAHVVLSFVLEKIKTGRIDVDVSGVNDSGQTPLHLAAAIGNTQACRLLLSAGAFPDIADELSNTPLHLAVAIGNYDTAVVLIREGLCDLDPVGQFNKTPLQLALSSKQYKLAQLLYDSGASVTRNELDILRVAAGIEAGANAPAVYWICHSEEDYPSAVRLRKELARSGIKSVCEKWKFDPRLHNWSTYAGIIFVLSRFSITDPRCVEEVYSAYYQNKMVIGVLIDDVLVRQPLKKLIYKILVAVPQTKCNTNSRPASGSDSMHDSLDSLAFSTDSCLGGGSLASSSFGTGDNSHESLDTPAIDPVPEPPAPLQPVAVPATVMATLLNILRSIPQRGSYLLSTLGLLPPIANVQSPAPPKLVAVSDLPVFLTQTGCKPSAVDSLVHDRSVRVFISSTFLDMQQEREVLVKSVFREVEHYCSENHITFSFVDLRWGITEEMSTSGKVITTCLREVERCRPYFLCMLGERYGWHDMADTTGRADTLLADTFNDAVNNGYKWVERYRDRSVTELEVIYGALRYIPMSKMSSHNPDNFGYAVSDEQKEQEFAQLRSLFYLRDPSFVDSIPSKSKDLYAAENYLAKCKMSDLRENIKASELKWRSYRYIDNFAKMVKEDLVANIAEQFRGEKLPTTYELEEMKHSSFAIAMIRAYVPALDLVRQAHEHISSPARIVQPLVINGPVGCGKSALIAYLYSFYKQMNTSQLVVAHFVSASDKSVQSYELARRVIIAIKNHYQVQQEVPQDKDELVKELPSWLLIAESRGGMVLFLDGLDQLSNTDGSIELDWLPEKFSPNVRVILSSGPRSSLQTSKLSWRVWPQLTIPQLSPAQIAAITGSVLSIRSKRLSDRQMQLLINSTKTKDPLFLRILLDELCTVGTFETITDLLGSYLNCPNVKSLYQSVFKRWETDYGAQFVTNALSLLFVARQGLSEYELLDILQCPHDAWTRLFMSLRDALLFRNGLLTFGNSSIIEAVRERYVSDSRNLRDARKKVADHFAAQSGVTARVAAELPYQLKSLQHWKSLMECLSSIPMFTALYTDETWNEIVDYWRVVEEAYRDEKFKLPHNEFPEGCDIVLKSFEASVTQYEATSPFIRDLGYVLFNIAEFLRDIARYSSAEPFYRRTLEIRQELHEAVVSSNTAYPLEKLAAPNVEGQSVPEELGITYDGLSGLCRMLSLYTQSVEFSEKAIEILELLPKNKSWAWSMMTALGNYGATLGKLVRLSEAEQAGRRAVKIGEEMLPDTDPELPRVYNALSIILKKQKRFSEAEPLCKQSIRLREKVLGPNHSDLSSSLMNLGNIYAKMGLLHEAITAYNRAYQITVQVQGERHPYAAQCKYSIGKLYQKHAMIGLARSNLAHAYQLAVAIYGNSMHAFVRKLVQKLLELHGYSSERSLLQNVARTITAVVDVGLRKTECLTFDSGGRIIANKWKTAPQPFGEIARPIIPKWVPRIIEKKTPEPTASTPTLWQILMGHAPAASAGTADLLESSDEDIKEECESSDEDADMGFGLFD